METSNNFMKVNRRVLGEIKSLLEEDSRVSCCIPVDVLFCQETKNEFTPWGKAYLIIEITGDDGNSMLHVATTDPNEIHVSVDIDQNLDYNYEGKRFHYLHMDDPSMLVYCFGFSDAKTSLSFAEKFKECIKNGMRKKKSKKKSKSAEVSQKSSNSKYKGLTLDDLTEILMECGLPGNTLEDEIQRGLLLEILRSDQGGELADTIEAMVAGATISRKSSITSQEGQTESNSLSRKTSGELPTPPPISELPLKPSQRNNSRFKPTGLEALVLPTKKNVSQIKPLKKTPKPAETKSHISQVKPDPRIHKKPINPPKKTPDVAMPVPPSSNILQPSGPPRPEKKKKPPIPGKEKSAQLKDRNPPSRPLPIFLKPELKSKMKEESCFSEQEDVEDHASGSSDGLDDLPIPPLPGVEDVFQPPPLSSSLEEKPPVKKTQEAPRSLLHQQIVGGKFKLKSVKKEPVKHSAIPPSSGNSLVDQIQRRIQSRRDAFEDSESETSEEECEEDWE